MAAHPPLRRDNSKWKNSTWRQNDKHRRRAISAFVRSCRDELLKELPDGLQTPESRRNWLIRVGRVRFAQLPEEEQARLLRPGVVAVPPPVGASDGGVAVSRSPDPGAHAVDGGVAESRSPDAGVVCSPALLGVGGEKAVKSTIMAEFPYLQRKFRGPLVFDVLAAAFRVLERIGAIMQGKNDRIKAAICVGMGAKLAAVSPSYTLDIWRRFTTPKMIPYMRLVELQMVAAWAKAGL